MHTVSETEAIEYLGKPKLCRDAPYWEPRREQPNVHFVECGLLHQDDKLPSGLYLSLQYQRSRTTGMVRYLFTLFKLAPGGPQRVYQLDIRQHARKIKALHDLSHEHVGRRRFNGDPTWEEWSFDDVLRYFCERTRISFTPPLDDPEDFKLRP